MSALYYEQLALDWSPQKRLDKQFTLIGIIVISAMLAIGVTLSSIPVPEKKRAERNEIPERIANLLLEKKKVAPAVKKETPLPEVKKKELEKKIEPKKKIASEKKIEPKKKKKIEPGKKEPSKAKRQTAREIAKKSGLIALSDDLADLRESFDLSLISDLPQQEAVKQEIKIASTGDLLTSAAEKSSGGITNTLTRKIGSSELATRKTTTVKSNIESEKKTKSKINSQSSTGTKKRSKDEIEQVFQKNKGAIFAIYNRALRKNPTLQGKVVVELTIAPNGSVTSVKIISSDLNDKSLERKLVLKIKKFKFSSSSASRITVSYPIDFLPS
jgi:protein TonB